jgi:quercetin dioxygenase-like cupin family protein
MEQVFVPPAPPPGALGAQVVVPCVDLAATLAFFTERLGMRVEMISPADAPTIAVVGGLGTRLRLEQVPADRLPADPPSFVVTATDPATVEQAVGTLVAPNGSRVTVLPAEPQMVVPPVVHELVVSRFAEAGGFHPGRAGMDYRDLVPSRLGGRFVASHIRIERGGVVPDYVHFHQVRFQIIFCARGWVRLVYEDQGDPFVLEAGDCVVQPPRIRHRVLEASPGLEVIEVGCPAVHDTFADPGTPLPTGRLLPDRDFGGQRFVRHVAATAIWSPSRHAGLDQRDTGIGMATGGIGGVRVLRPSEHRAANAPWLSHDAELVLHVVLDGAATFELQGHEPLHLGTADSVAVPAGLATRWVDPTDELQLLEVTLPDVVPTVAAPSDAG